MPCDLGAQSVPLFPSQLPVNSEPLCGQGKWSLVIVSLVRDAVLWSDSLFILRMLARDIPHTNIDISDRKLFRGCRHTKTSKWESGKSLGGKKKPDVVHFPHVEGTAWTVMEKQPTYMFSIFHSWFCQTMVVFGVCTSYSDQMVQIFGVKCRRNVLLSSFGLLNWFRWPLKWWGEKNTSVAVRFSETSEHLTL